MLTALKHYLRLAMIPTLYFGGILLLLLTIFKNAEWGFYLLTIIIPQPNIKNKLLSYPFGKDYIDFFFAAIAIGMFVQKRGFAKTTSSSVIIIYAMLSYFALINASLNFNLPLPVTTSNYLLFDWKNYVEMILLYFIALNIVKDEKKVKVVIIIIAVVVLLIALRSFRNFTGGASFSYDKRYGGPFEAVGLGANHLGAFIVHYGAVLLGIYLFDNDKKRKILLLVTCLLCLHPIMFSYSRGAYLAAIGVLTLFGILKKRSLLVIVAIVALSWQTLLPPSVVDRIMMTEQAGGQLEGSAAHRLELWDHAVNLFQQNPVFGVGFGSFGFTVQQGELTDTHNFYIKTLAEQGIVGIICFAALLAKALSSGWRLYKSANTPFLRGLGFGFMGSVAGCMITNLFGDRWSYFVLGGYFWIFWGLVDRAHLILKNPQTEVEQPT